MLLSGGKMHLQEHFPTEAYLFSGFWKFQREFYTIFGERDTMTGNIRVYECHKIVIP